MSLCLFRFSWSENVISKNVFIFQKRRLYSELHTLPSDGLFFLFSLPFISACRTLYKIVRQEIQ
jgi:hypothetical protein